MDGWTGPIDRGVSVQERSDPNDIVLVGDKLLLVDWDARGRAL